MSREFEKIYTAYGLLEADMVRLMLEAAGIEVVTRRESAGAVYGLTVGSLGEVLLYVPEEQFAEATELLDAMENGKLETSDDESTPYSDDSLD
ncbi:MAG: DUF2007 domain-containing protein [Bellilinea sp.]|jgi:hypothetical protein